MASYNKADADILCRKLNMSTRCNQVNSVILRLCCLGDVYFRGLDLQALKKVWVARIVWDCIKKILQFCTRMFKTQLSDPLWSNTDIIVWQADSHSDLLLCQVIWSCLHGKVTDFAREDQYNSHGYCLARWGNQGYLSLSLDRHLAPKPNIWGHMMCDVQLRLENEPKSRETESQGVSSLCWLVFFLSVP